jgi:hypothetical protein
MSVAEGLHCEYLILSMEQAGIIYGRNGFEKDKSKERDPEFPQEEATHISDAADTLFIGSNFHPTESSTSGVPSTLFMD